MQQTRTSPTQSPPTRLRHKCASCDFTGTASELVAHAEKANPIHHRVLSYVSVRQCRCGAWMFLQSLYLCEGCDKPGPDKCECTLSAAHVPELLEAAQARGADSLPEVPPQPTLGDELETLAALLGQLVLQTKRTIAAGATHLGPLHTVSGLEGMLERLLGSVELHSKHLANTRRQLSDNRALLVDQLRDRAQKAQINRDSADAHWLARLADNLPQQLPEGVRHG